MQNTDFFMGLPSYFSKEIETLLFEGCGTKEGKMWAYLPEKISSNTD